VSIRKDNWLSERFGHPVFTVEGPEGPDESEGPAMYQARVPAEDVATLTALQAAGMRVVNVTATLTADPSKPIPAGDVEVRSAGAEGDDALLDVAQRTFRFSRFHLDPDVPDEVADRIKRDWVWSYLNGKRGDELLVAVSDGVPVGFLCVLGNVIDLAGVAPETRGLGAGRALVSAFHERSAGRFEAVEVGTQAANVRAMVFYGRLGYVPARFAYDLHMHVR
jgi:GNAT superfamily N-acetyltransferase